MDQHLFAMLYDAHAKAVYGHAVRMTADPVGAEDIVSLTFLEAWRLRDSIAGVSSERAWLFGVATNVIRNTRRTARRHRDALTRLPPPGAVPDLADGVASRIDDSEQLVAALAALERLRRADREVILMHVWAGLSHEEVAQACGVTVGTVRSRLSRARARLRKLVAATSAETRPTSQTSLTSRPNLRRSPASRTVREGQL
ncbi:RNA polymerase sigma factor [Streptomyces sp. NPDC048603]|uniref:RNA polymerase sigma factor n=1 Tax=Streptomyces sp. NPDC048603 TaxID=3365577 RepID=UPI003712E683